MESTPTQAVPASPAELPNKPSDSQIMQHIESIVKQNGGQVDPELRRLAKLYSEALTMGEAATGGGKGVGRDDYRVAAAFAAAYMKIADTRKKLLKDVDSMRKFYMCDVILHQLVEDALAPEIGTGNIVDVNSERPEIQKEIDHLQEKFDLDALILAIAPDMLAYGEYTLQAKVNPAPSVNKEGTPAPEGKTKGRGKAAKIHEEGKPEEYGLVDIMDSVDQASVIAITKWNQIESYLVQDGKGRIVQKEPADYIKFSLSSQRVRVDLWKEYSVDKSVPQVLKNLPRYVRVGKSYIWPIIAKLKELELLEAMVPATKLSKLSSGTLIGVNVPAGYDVESAMEAAKQVEQMINRKVGYDPVLQELTIENIMSSAGRLKVVPIFGDKGQLQKMDYKPDEPDELLASVEDIRKVILTSIGIPYELVFGSDETDKGAILKKYARYLRKLKNIQKAVEEGVRQMIYIHLANKGINFVAEDVKVEFFNKLIEVDNLDKLEFMDTVIGLLKNAKDFVTDLAQDEHLKDRINWDIFFDYLNEQLNVVGFTNLILVDTAKHAHQQKPANDPNNTPPAPKIGGPTMTRNTGSAGTGANGSAPPSQDISKNNAGIVS